ncbi:MAG: hypothetical protein LAP85_02330 [Acidobacteriia bacterium]|nr:hypothetical protein [Terriglobia bacterium]
MPSSSIGVCFVIGMKGPAGHEVLGVTEWPRKITAHPKDKIFWAILNTTDSTVNVSLSKFVKLGQRIRVIDPLDFHPDPPGRSAHVRAGAPGVIKAVVKKSAGYGLYAYTILIDGRAALDPELEIERPSAL